MIIDKAGYFFYIEYMEYKTCFSGKYVVVRENETIFTIDNFPVYNDDIIFMVEES